MLDKALQSISQAGYGQLVKMLITFEADGILKSVLHTYLLENCSNTGMHNGDEASPSIIFWPVEVF